MGVYKNLTVSGYETITGYCVINGSYSTSYSDYGYLSQSGAGTVSGSSGSVNVSLHTASRIYCGEVDAFSDYRLKDIIDRLNPKVALDAVLKLNPIHYDWKPETGQHDGHVKAGLIAQEVAYVIPEAVIVGPGKHFADEHMLNYDTLFVYGLSAVQQLSKENDKLRKRVQILEEKLFSLNRKGGH
jgi:hypothetical protein